MTTRSCTQGLSRKAGGRRRGSVYLIVLGTSTIAMVIGLSALVSTRVRQRTAQGTADFIRARNYALSAVDLGFLHIQQNPTTWRNDFATGNLPTDQSIGRGTLSLVATDPVDADLTNNTTDPVLLTGIGLAGPARYKLQVTLDPNGVLTPATWRRVVD